MYIRVVKPIFDYAFAFVCCILLMPITLFVALFIKLDDGGPVFFVSKRLGKNGKPFGMLKFRSMKVNSTDIRNADGTTFSSRDDTRLTKAGKVLRETSIDELPQFFNVLLGQMSVLGPRPDPIEWFEKLPEDMRVKYSVKPGISGYSQAYYRNTLPLDDKNRNEVFYAQNMSFTLDTKIFFVTLARLFGRSGVYRADGNEESKPIGKEMTGK